MTKQKRSFFERLTGIKKIETTDEEGPMIQPIQPRNDYMEPSYLSKFEAQEETYEFPSYDEPVMPAASPVQEQQPPIQQSVSVAAGELVSDAEGQLTIDVYQTDDDIVIKSTIAGVKPEDLDVNINNDMVTIRGDRKQDEEVDQENYYYQECYWGTFSRSVILPVEIIAEKAEATMKNGILTIRLPKADTTKTRRIQVRGY